MIKKMSLPFLLKGKKDNDYLQIELQNMSSQLHPVIWLSKETLDTQAL